MDIQEKVFTETKTAIRAEYDIRDVDLEHGMISVELVLKDDQGNVVNRSGYNLPVSEYINTVALRDKLYEEAGIVAIN